MNVKVYLLYANIDIVKLQHKQGYNNCCWYIHLYIFLL